GEIFLILGNLVIERINVVEKSGIWILSNEIIKQLQLIRRILFRGGRLIGVIFRHGVLLSASRGASVLRRCRNDDNAEQAQRRCNSQTRQPTCNVHSLISSLQPQRWNYLTRQRLEATVPNADFPANQMPSETFEL